MKIVFIGTVKFSELMLEKLIELNAQIVGVCTKQTSTFNSDFSDLSIVCNKHNLQYKYIDNINSDETIHWVSSLKPDIIFCFGWSELIKRELLHVAPMGILGYHPSKLPQNRGRHPLIWALALGLNKTASTFFFMTEGADSGDILSQKEFDILDTDDAQSLYNKMTKTAQSQLEDFLPLLKNGTFKTSVQDESQANIWRKRSKKDGEIDFRMSSLAIYNLVRALTHPYVGAHIHYKEKDIIIWKVEIYDDVPNNIEFGKVLESTQEYILVKTFNGAVKILEHEFETLPSVGEYL